MNKLFSTVAFLMLAGNINTATAATINLDMSSGVFDTFQGYSNSRYNQDGFTLATPIAASNHQDDCSGIFCWHEGSANTTDMILTLSFGGNAFDLLSFDASDWSTPGNLIVQSNNGDILNIGTSLGTFTANFLNVTSVTFDLAGGLEVFDSKALDNILVSNIPTSNVPEPSSIGLITLCLAGLGWSRKRQTQI